MRAFALLVLVALLALAPAAFAQGTISDGGSNFDFNNFTSTSGASTDFEVPTGTDHLFANWYWFRLAGGAAETAFPAPDSQSYVGNTATLDWADVGGAGFSARLELVITGGAGTAEVFETLTLTNLSTANSLDIDIINYADFDVSASAGGDSATLLNANDHIQIVDGANTAEFRALDGGIAYQVDAFPALRDLLNDGAVTNLNNVGLPFAPGDFTGGLQWSLSIPAAGSATVREVLTVNEPAVPVELDSFSIQ